MRVITDQTRDAWLSDVKDGDNAGHVRATIEVGLLKWFEYNTENSPGCDYGNDRPRTGHYSSMIFSGAQVKEIPNIATLQIQRSLDQDVATMTMTVLNTSITPMGETEDSYTSTPEYDIPGILSPSWGKPSIEANRWGHTIETGWEEMFVPDRIVKTYEGYGIDNTVPPGFDPHMYSSGVWLIDTVDLNAAGDLVIKARDLGRLLIDHIAMPPDIPWDSYPLEFSKIRSEVVQGRGPTGGDWSTPRSHVTTSSSNDAYIGLGITDRPEYVSPHGNVLGHRDFDPLSVDASAYWLSTGQESSDSMVWWEIDLDSPRAMAALRLKSFGGPFQIYVSLHDGTDWIGKKKIPYKVTTENVDIGAKIPFVHTERLERSQPVDVVFRRKHDGVKKVRITFTRLRRRPAAEVYPWRAGLHTFQMYTGTFASLGFDTSGEVLKPVGNYHDYSSIVKMLCAWGGFYWPEADNQCTIAYGYNGDLSADFTVTYSHAGHDRALAKGHVWGSFQDTGTSGVADLTADQFDKQPLMDAVQVVRNIIGFNFFIDENGGVQWRMPNLYSFGNYVTPSHLDPERVPSYSTDHIVLDERTILTDYATTLDSQNLRERIAVASSNGKVGAVIKGYSPENVGLRRISCWTDSHWETNRECRVAADMVAAQQMFSYRHSTVTIPANPAIQIDDQIRIYERMTNETFYHYVNGISSTFDAASQKLEYVLDVHWLGERPSDAWVVRVSELDAFTQEFLATLAPPS